MKQILLQITAHIMNEVMLKNVSLALPNLFLGVPQCCINMAFAFAEVERLTYISIYE